MTDKPKPKQYKQAEVLAWLTELEARYPEKFHVIQDRDLDKLTDVERLALSNGAKKR